MVLSGREPLGVALLTVDRHRRGPFTFRRVHLGTAGEPPGETVFVERNRFLARPEDEAQVGAAIVRSCRGCRASMRSPWTASRSEEHTSELQSRQYLVCRL